MKIIDLEETENFVSSGAWISVPDTSQPMIIDDQIRFTQPILGHRSLPHAGSTAEPDPSCDHGVLPQQSYRQ